MLDYAFVGVVTLTEPQLEGAYPVRSKVIVHQTAATETPLPSGMLPTKLLADETSALWTADDPAYLVRTALAFMTKLAVLPADEGDEALIDRLIERKRGEGVRTRKLSNRRE